jgi:hypothetical protein
MLVGGLANATRLTVSIQMPHSKRFFFNDLANCRAKKLFASGHPVYVPLWSAGLSVKRLISGFGNRILKNHA